MSSTNTTKTNKNIPSYCYSFSNTNTKQFINIYFCSVSVRDCSHIFTQAKPFGFERMRELLQSGTTQGRNLLSARPKLACFHPGKHSHSNKMKALSFFGLKVPFPQTTSLHTSSVVTKRKEKDNQCDKSHFNPNLWSYRYENQERVEDPVVRNCHDGN